MENKELAVPLSISIREAIRVLDITGKKILVVVENDVLVGVITDGDIRRWILKNGNLNENISEIINTNPIILFKREISKAKNLMKKNKVEAIPIVDEQGKFKDIIFWDETFGNEVEKTKKINNVVVIMAGGKGTRLYPYTKILPKPLIPIGEVSIVERIIQKFCDVGCNQFFLTVNYKKNMIKAYLEEVDKDYGITYIEEEKFLGTAGSLYLLKDKITESFFVSNCDILVDANYDDILEYHKKSQNKITMVTSLKNYVIPYGVIKTDNQGCISTISEKPEYNFQVNTGLYVLEPEVLKDIPINEVFHITDLINQYVESGQRVGVYPVTENAWLDMGEIKEMQAMIQKLGIEV